MRVEREDFLRRLQTVKAGLSARDIIEQSCCFIFQDGQVATFNDEVSCHTSSGLDDKFVGAIAAAPLLAVLEKLPEKDVELSMRDGELVVIGKNRRVGVRAEAEILLPLGAVEKPKKWKPLHPDFIEAVSAVSSCASTDASRLVLTCVHVHPEWVEACDHHQLSRYTIKTGLDKSLLIRRDSLKHVCALGVSEVSVTETWAHFRNASGLVLSCRQYVDSYPDLTPLLKVKGAAPATLPKGLAEAADTASVFSAENTDRNVVTVEIRAGKLRIKGVGTNGWYQEVKKLKYSGPPLSFMISPELLSELVKKYNDCEITNERLKVVSGAQTYVGWLFKIDNNTVVKEENDDEESDDE